MVGIADVEKAIETAELGGDVDSEPVIVLDEDAPTAVKDIPALNFQSTEVEAEYAEEDEDTPTDEAVDGGGVRVVQGERDSGQDPQYATSDV